MNFFQELVKTGVNDVIIQYSKNSDKDITVVISPKNIIKGNPLLQINPIVISGTPESVDKEFNDNITKALAVAQKLHEVLEANKPKEEPKAKETVKAKAPKAKPKEVVEKSEPVAEEPKVEEVKKEEPKVEAPKVEEVKKEVPAAQKQQEEPKVNNEKVLKDYMTTIKGQNIFLYKDIVEDLYSKLDEKELTKPLAKRVRIELDIAIRKDKQITDARNKMMGITPVVADDLTDAQKEDEAYEAMAHTAFYNKTENSTPPAPPVPPKQSLKYDFPKPFDEDEDEDYDEDYEDLGGTGHGDE